MLYSSISSRGSCVAPGTLLRTPMGVQTAGAIYMQVAAGRRPRLLADERGEFVGEVLVAAHTRALGVRVVTDDEALDVTLGHMVLLDMEEDREFPLEIALPAGELSPGDRLVNGQVVRELVPLGVIEAIRFYPLGHGWPLTAGGIAIGTRWHEVAAAYALPPHPGDPEWAEWAEWAEDQGYYPLGHMMAQRARILCRPDGMVQLAQREGQHYSDVAEQIRHTLESAWHTITAPISEAQALMREGVWVQRPPPLWWTDCPVEDLGTYRAAYFAAVGSEETAAVTAAAGR